jgi:hypothetical protein
VRRRPTLRGLADRAVTPRTMFVAEEFIMKKSSSTRKPLSRGKKIAIAATAIGLAAAVPVAYTLLKRRSVLARAKKQVSATKQLAVKAGRAMAKKARS